MPTLPPHSDGWVIGLRQAALYLHMRKEIVVEAVRRGYLQAIRPDEGFATFASWRFRVEWLDRFLVEGLPKLLAELGRESAERQRARRRRDPGV